MLPTILLVFPLVILYVFLTTINKQTKSKEETTSSEERCAYCDIARNLH